MLRCLSSRCHLVFSSSSHCAALSSSNRAGWLLRRLSSRRRLVFSSRRTLILLSSSHCAALLLSHRAVWLLCRPSSRRCLVLSSSSHFSIPTSLAVPATMAVVVGVGLAIASLLHLTLPWMLFLALQPYRRSNRCCRRRQCPFRRPPPSPTLVAVTITITLVVAIAIACSPPLSPLP